MRYMRSAFVRLTDDQAVEPLQFSSFENWQFERMSIMHLVLLSATSAFLLLLAGFVDKGDAWTTDVVGFLICTILLVVRCCAHLGTEQYRRFARSIINLIFLVGSAFTALWMVRLAVTKDGTDHPATALSSWLSNVTGYLVVLVVASLLAVTLSVSRCGFVLVLLSMHLAIGWALCLDARHAVRAAELASVQLVTAGAFAFAFSVNCVMYLWLDSINRKEYRMLRAQPELASYLFHELRNDQNAIGGVLEIIDEQVDDGTATLTDESTEMMRDARLHATHACDVCSGNN